MDRDNKRSKRRAGVAQLAIAPVMLGGGIGKAATIDNPWPGVLGIIGGVLGVVGSSAALYRHARDH